MHRSRGRGSPEGARYDPRTGLGSHRTENPGALSGGDLPPGRHRGRGGRGMRNVLSIAQRELGAFFVSPIAYVVLMLFLLLSGFFNYSYISAFAERYAQYQAIAQAYRNPQILQQLNVNQMIVQPLLSTISVILIFLMPIVTMRSFAEDRRNGIDELLFTSPVSTAQLVFGKFLGAFTFYLVMLALTLHYPAILMKYGNPEKGPILAGYLGLLLLGTAYLTFGLFASSLTKNQMVAAVIGFVGLLLFWLVGVLSGRASGAWKEIISYIALIDHFQNFTKGVIDTKDLAFFGSFVCLFLVLTKLSLDSLRWR
ncbi:MAG: ABC transporter [Deltaproteobacteria bacterium]|nr:MAG: ABC transporter [Deltaproteobacteria bacterium]